MLRDTRKTAGYFEEYIACQMERIQKFEDVLRNLGANDTAKNMQCHMYLANFYQDLLLAEYSSGGSTGLLKRDCLKYLSHVCPQDSLPYLESGWYESSRGAAWYESHTLDRGTYCGYWCLAGAAVIKIMGWNPSLFAGTEYCPADLLL